MQQLSNNGQCPLINEIGDCSGLGPPSPPARASISINADGQWVDQERVDRDGGRISTPEGVPASALPGAPTP